MDELVQALQTFLAYLDVSRLQPLGYWSYLILAFLVAFEGPMATFLGAAAASTGWMNPFLVFTAAVAGNFAADIAWYSFGYYGRIDWFLRHERWTKLNLERWSKLRRDIRAHAARILFVTKVTSSLIIPALIAAGLARVPRRHWMGFLVLGECIRTGLVVALGYYIGESIKRFQMGFQVVAIVGIIIIAVVVGRYFLSHKTGR